MNPIRSASVSVARLDEAVANYARWLGYQPVELGSMDAGVSASLGAPAMAGRRFAVLRPDSGIPIDLRLIENGPPPAAYRPLRSYGWAAIEICVQDVLATQERLRDSPFEIIGPPAGISSLPTIHPMQVQGPDGEVIFLTQILDESQGSGLRKARAPIDTLFICVMACRDMPAMGRWVSHRLASVLAPELAIPYRMLARSFDLPPSQLHRIATAERDGLIFLEFDQYPEAATDRPTRPGSLPPGVCVVTLSHHDLAAVPGPWFSVPEPRLGAIYEGRKVGVLRTPEGTLIEVVEGAP